MLFGAGGAARAVAVELALVGTRKIIVVNRDAERGRELVDTVRSKTKVEAELVVWNVEYQIPEGTDVVINGTSIGLYEPEAKLAFDLETLLPGTVVADVVFNPVRTKLLNDAEARGCKIVDGLGMLVNQGVIGIQHWTGMDPDPVVMRQALEQAMGV